jgi:hypothetical protein
MPPETQARRRLCSVLCAWGRRRKQDPGKRRRGNARNGAESSSPTTHLPPPRCRKPCRAFPKLLKGVVRERRGALSSAQQKRRRALVASHHGSPALVRQTRLSAIAQHAVTRRAAPRRAAPLHAVQCCAMPCHAAPRHATPCGAMPWLQMQERAQAADARPLPTVVLSANDVSPEVLARISAAHRAHDRRASAAATASKPAAAVEQRLSTPASAAAKAVCTSHLPEHAGAWGGAARPCDWS